MKKTIVAILGLIAPAAALSQQTLGTKAGGDISLPSSGGSGLGFGALVQMLFALGIVIFLLKTVLPKFAGKLTKKLVTTTNGGINIEESAQFAGGSLYIVSARGKTLLLSVSNQGVTNLADLSGPLPKVSDPFEEVLANATGDHAVVTQEADLQAQLDRLSQISAGHAL